MPCTRCQKDDHNVKTSPEIVETVQINLPVEDILKMKMLIRIFEEVAHILKKGRTEAVYQNAILHELQKMGIQYTDEETMPIMYKGKYVGQERLDIILHSWLDIVFELKAVAADIKPEHYWQVLSYMRYKKYTYGVVVNFNQSPNKQLAYSFLIIHEDTSYIYDVSTGEGILMKDYDYV